MMARRLALTIFLPAEQLGALFSQHVLPLSTAHAQSSFSEHALEQNEAGVCELSGGG